MVNNILTPSLVITPLQIILHVKYYCFIHGRHLPLYVNKILVRLNGRSFEWSNPHLIAALVFINVFIVIIWYLWQLNGAGEIILVYIFIQKLIFSVLVYLLYLLNRKGDILVYLLYLFHLSCSKAVVGNGVYMGPLRNQECPSVTF